MPYRRDRRYNHGGYFYGEAVLPWLSSYGYLGYPDFYEYPPWWDYDESPDGQATAQGPVQPDYGPQPPVEEPTNADSLPPWPSNNTPEYPEQQPATPMQPSAPQPFEPVTLVFNDGRPSERVHNYLLTAGMLYVMDQQREEIPIADLDLAATIKINRKAGIEFNVPGTSR